MFYDNFIELCKKHRIKPSVVAKEIGLTNSSATYWKRGSVPKLATMQKIADYFNVSLGELLGIGDDENLNKVVKAFPNARVTETEDKVSIQIIEKPTAIPDSEELRRKLLLEKYDSLTAKGKMKVLDYATEISRLPEYKAPAKE